MRAFRCDQCPLVFEVGGYGYWDLTGRCGRVVCTSCGTMHRLEERHGVCRVLALPGPVRHLPLVKRVDSTGYEYEAHEWPYTPEDWREVGRAASTSEFGAGVQPVRCGTAVSVSGVAAERGRELAGVRRALPVMRRAAPLGVRRDDQLSAADAESVAAPDPAT